MDNKVPNAVAPVGESLFERGQDLVRRLGNASARISVIGRALSSYAPPEVGNAEQADTLEDHLRLAGYSLGHIENWLDSIERGIGGPVTRMDGGSGASSNYGVVGSTSQAKR